VSNQRNASGKVQVITVDAPAVANPNGNLCPANNFPVDRFEVRAEADGSVQFQVARFTKATSCGAPKDGVTISRPSSFR
jgi:hypothetical protein